MGKNRTRNATPTTATLETWNLDSLTENPRQSHYFRNLSEAELQALADDIKHNGQREPIQVLPSGPMLDGHQRALALRLNGETTAKVMVRYDLADAEDATIEQTMLAFNTNRRQLDPLEKARIALRLFELEKGPSRTRFYRDEIDELRDRVGKVLGMGGRNLQRYINVLYAPPEVQEAFRSGRINLIDASRVTGLPDEQCDQLVALLREGSDPRPFLASIFRAQGDRHRRAPDALNAFRRDLERGLADLAGREDEVAPSTIRRWLPTLESAHALLGRLIDMAKNDQSPPPSARLKEMQSRVKRLK